MPKQRLIIEKIFALPRVLCVLLCATILVLGFYAHESGSLNSDSKVANAKIVSGIYKNNL